MSLKPGKVVFGPSGGWGIVPLTQSHSPYLHDKSRSQGRATRLWCYAFLFFFFSIYFHLFKHHFSLIRGEWRNHSGNLDLVQHTPRETGRGNCLCGRHVPPPASHLPEWEAGTMFNIPLTVPSPPPPPPHRVSPSTLILKRTQIAPPDYKSKERAIWIFTLVSFSVQSSDFLQLELWEADADCITVTEVIYPSHTVLCNSISHLAWAEGDTQESIPIAAPRRACPIENSAV